MKHFLLIFYITLSSFAIISISQASDNVTVRLFSLFRTNYHPEKTMLYNLSYDKKACRITSSYPVDISFIDTLSGKTIAPPSKMNRDYLAPRNVSSPNPQTVNFDFIVVNEVEKINNKDYLFQVQLLQTKSGCKPTTHILSYGKPIITNLKKMDTKFNLVEYPIFGLQPSKNNAINWLRVHGDQTLCLVGKCD